MTRNMTKKLPTPRLINVTMAALENSENILLSREIAFYANNPEARYPEWVQQPIYKRVQGGIDNKLAALAGWFTEYATVDFKDVWNDNLDAVHWYRFNAGSYLWIDLGVLNGEGDL